MPVRGPTAVEPLFILWITFFINLAIWMLNVVPLIIDQRIKKKKLGFLGKFILKCKKDISFNSLTLFHIYCNIFLHQHKPSKAKNIRRHLCIYCYKKKNKNKISCR